MSFEAALNVRGTRTVAEDAGSMGPWNGPIGPADHAHHTDFGVASEAWIGTAEGSVRAADLKVGDLVATAEDGPRRLVSVAHSTKDIGADRIRIARGALGGGLPVADLVVGRSTRLRVQSDIARRLTGSEHAVVEAGALVGQEGISQAGDTLSNVTHLIFESHAFVVAEGVAVEVFRPDAQWLDTLPFEARDTVFETLPKLRYMSAVSAYECGLPSLEPREVRQILAGDASFSGGAAEAFERFNAPGSARAG